MKPIWAVRPDPRRARRQRTHQILLESLTTALARADHPEQPSDPLRRERLACGIDDRALDNLVTQSRRENGHYRLPGYGATLEQIVHDLRLMAAPCCDDHGRRVEFAERLERMLAQLSHPKKT